MSPGDQALICPSTRIKNRYEIKLVEGGIENGYSCTFLPTTALYDNTLCDSDIQLLSGFIWFWKISLFYTQCGTNMAQMDLLQYCNFHN